MGARNRCGKSGEQGRDIGSGGKIARHAEFTCEVSSQRGDGKREEKK